jgi:hypothetical protein
VIGGRRNFSLSDADGSEDSSHHVESSDSLNESRIAFDGGRDVRLHAHRGDLDPRPLRFLQKKGHSVSFEPWWVLFRVEKTLAFVTEPGTPPGGGLGPADTGRDLDILAARYAQEPVRDLRSAHGVVRDRRNGPEVDLGMAYREGEGKCVVDVGPDVRV